MDNKTLQILWYKIRPAKTWYFVVVCIVSGTVAVVGLRQNNLTMIDLREKVYLADKDDGNVEQALQDLRIHVHSHMNTSLSGGDNAVYPPIQLKYTYQRLVDAEQKRSSDRNGSVYSDAQAHCERLYPQSVSGGPRVPCIQEYVTTHGGQQTKKIPDSLYKFNFASPSWSPDVAGWSIIISAFSGLAAIIRFCLGRWLKSRAE